MKILIVDELCYPQLGGQQVRFKELAEQWVAAGHEVTITAIDHLATSPEKEIINKVQYQRIIKDADYYKSGLFGRKISTIIRFTFKLHPYFKQNWDLIIFNQFPMLPEIFYKYFYKKRAKTAVDFVEHRDSSLWKIINKQILNSADKVICISRHIMQCASLYRSDNLYVIPSLVEMTNNQSTKQDYLFLGRLEQHKHPDHAIETVLNYNNRFNATKVINIVGKGNMFDELSAKYKDTDCIKFHGSVENSEKQAILERSRILILPSEREGLPKVVIESLGYAIPTLTTTYPLNGTQFFVKEEQIGLVAQPSIDDLADKLSQLENDYEKYSENCEKIKWEYDLKLNSEKYLNIFNN